MILFLVSRTNSLSYFLPLSNFLNQNDIENCFVLLYGNDKKYNSLGLLQNKENVITLLLNRNLKFQVINSFEEILNFKKTNVLFSLEGNGITSSIFKRKFKHILIQNYHDFSFSMQYPKTKFIYDNCDYIWFNDKFFGEEIASNLLKFKKEKTINNILPNFWAYKDAKKEKILKSFGLISTEKEKLPKIALCFLPRPKETVMLSWNDVLYTPCETFRTGNPKDYINHALSFGKKLEKEDYIVFYKQRIKNRNTEWKKIKNYVEDFRWFPNVSLDLLYVSDLVYGYMTSAILDASFFGTRFLNFKKVKYPVITEKIFKFYENFENIKTLSFFDDENYEFSPCQKKDNNKKIEKSQKEILNLCKN